MLALVVYCVVLGDLLSVCVCVLVFVFVSEWDVVTRMIKAHFKALRSNRLFKRSWIYVYIEANLSFIGADAIANVIQCPENQPVVIAKQDATDKGRYGVWTGEFEKENYAALLGQLLRDNTMFYSDQYVMGARDEKIKTLQEQAVEYKAMMIEQLRNYRLEAKHPPDAAFGKVKFSYTGKTTNKKDDCVLVLSIALYWANRMREHPEYVTRQQEHNWRN